MKNIGMLLAVVGLALAVSPDCWAGYEINAVMGRSLLFQDWYADSANGGGYTRTELLTNTSADRTIRISSVEFLLLNPEDVGYTDIYGPIGGLTNVFDVIAAAGAIYPDWYMWGAQWWIDQDVDLATWAVVSESTSEPLPITLGPGASFLLDNTTYGQPLTPPDQGLPGELLIGFRFSGDFVEPPAIPEPCTLLVWSLLGASGLGWWRRRRSANKNVGL
jgi:hypothetical protein